jgi:hypothetical protein
MGSFLRSGGGNLKDLDPFENLGADRMGKCGLD